MKYKIIILFFLTSCTSNTYLDKGSFTYSAKGFAKIESQSFSNLDDKFFVSHNKLSLGTKIILTNPTNEKSLEMIIRKKVKYNNFYKVLISQEIAERLNLDLNFPYIEINEIKINKSFIAKKAVTENI